MKNSIYLALVLAVIFFLNSCKVQGDLEKAGIQFVEGSDLMYKVKAQGEEYTFDLNINQFSTNYISFDWDMDGMKSGTVSMSQEPLESATALMNYFSGGYSELENQTSVWLSQQLFKDLKSGKTVEIDLGNGDKSNFTNLSSESFCFQNHQNNKEVCLNVFIIYDETLKKEIWIANDPANRLIVKMDIGFEIELMGVK